jgi:hypothetical protein
MRNILERMIIFGSLEQVFLMIGLKRGRQDEGSILFEGGAS